MPIPSSQRPLLLGMSSSNPVSVFHRAFILRPLLWVSQKHTFLSSTFRVEWPSRGGQSRGYLLTNRLGIPLTPCSVSKFLSLETSVQIHSSVRDEDVFILQSPSPPSINDHLMELLIMISGQSLTSTGGIELIIQLARLLPPSESRLSSLVSHILGRTRKTSLELQSPPSQSGPSLQQGTANV